MMLDDLRRDATIADILRENVYVRPNAEALTDGTRRLSWQQVHDAALSSASHLAALGIRPGDRVAVILANQIEAVILYWACAISGIIFVGANPRLGYEDLENVLRHSGARIAFAADEGAAQRVELMELPELREVVCFAGSDPIANLAQPVQTYAVPASPKRDDVFTICYTSGTTGRPKGVILTHANLVWNAARTGEILRCTDQDAFLLAVSLTHVFGLATTLLVAAAFGARVVLLKTYAAAAALDLCEWEGVTIHHGTPTMFTLELAAQRRAPRDLSSLRTGIIGAAPVSLELVQAIRSELHCDVQIAWGLTECGPAATMTRFGDPPQSRCETVGQVIPDTLIQIDSGGFDAGEILVKGPSVFRGYYNDPEMTRNAFTSDGWFRTGDLGTIDGDGFLHVKGRLKEIIIRAGLHVYPDEVETLLMELPWIEAVALVGIPDPVLGERACACIVVNAEGDVPRDPLVAVRSAIAGRLADYKLPDAVLRVSELPRTSSGKVLKRVLREDAMARVAAN